MRNGNLKFILYNYTTLHGEDVRQMSSSPSGARACLDLDLDRTPQTEVHAVNQFSRYPRSGLKVCVGGGWWWWVVVGGKPNLVNSIDLGSS